MNPNQKALLGCLLWPVIFAVAMALVLLGFSRTFGVEFVHNFRHPLSHYANADELEAIGVKSGAFIESSFTNPGDLKKWAEHPVYVDYFAKAEHLMLDLERGNRSADKFHRERFGPVADRNSADYQECLNEARAMMLAELKAFAPGKPLWDYKDGFELNRENLNAFNNKKSPFGGYPGQGTDSVGLAMEFYRLSPKYSYAGFLRTEIPRCKLARKLLPKTPLCACVEVRLKSGEWHSFAELVLMFERFADAGADVIWLMDFSQLDGGFKVEADPMLVLPPQVMDAVTYVQEARK